MTLLNVDESLVLIIDIQDKLLNAAFNKETLEKKACTVSKAASILNIPVIVTEQYPKGLGSTIEPLKNCLNKDTLYFEKTAFSALEDSLILKSIKEYNRKKIVIFGIETHICVSQTAEALINRGYEVSVIQDACGSRAETEYKAGLERMKANGAYILTAEIALFEWLKGAKHPNFKEVQALIK